MWSWSNGDRISPDYRALFVAHQEEEASLQVVQEGDHLGEGQGQLVRYESGRHRLAEAGQFAHDEVPHLMMMGGHKGVAGVVAFWNLSEMLFPLLARDFAILASLAE